MLNTEIYNFHTIGHRDCLNNGMVINNKIILRMMENSQVRRTAKNINAVINQIVTDLQNSNSYKSVNVDDRNNITVKFKEVL